MKSRLWARVRRLLLVVSGMIAMLLALPAGAQVTLSPFVKGEYYLGKGGVPPTLAEVAAEPMRYLRSRAAYQALKDAFASVLNETLTDEQFRAVLVSNRVRLVPCEGRINTAGLTASGQVNWFERACYPGEELIEVRNAQSEWVRVASRGCFNLTRSAKPNVPAVSTAKPESCRWVCRSHSGSTTYSGVRLQLTVIEGCDGKQFYAGGLTTSSYTEPRQGQTCRCE